jgi:hypothetical protein
MLTQLSRLSSDVDGRFAQSEELQFLKDYLDSAEVRISAYQKIRDSHLAIVESVEEQVRSTDQRLFMRGSRDVTPLFQRDTKSILVGTASAMLINDLDHLRDRFLLWHRTIIRAVKVDALAQVVYQVLPNVVKAVLSEQEAPHVMPALYLDQTILGD